jgi:hypothetical protein
MKRMPSSRSGTAAWASVVEMRALAYNTATVVTWPNFSSERRQHDGAPDAAPIKTILANLMIGLAVRKGSASLSLASFPSRPILLHPRADRFPLRG